MSTFEERIKVDNPPQLSRNKMLEILDTYIAKEKELQREWDEEDGVDVNATDYEPEAFLTESRIKDFISYRRIRTEQAYLSKINGGENSRQFRGEMAELDRRRREVHNAALLSLRGLVDFGKRFGLEPLYEGKLLSEEEIESHDSMTYDVRMEMTDAFFNIINDINKAPLGLIDVKSKKELQGIQGSIESTDREFGVAKGLEADDGDIEFDDFKDSYRGF